MNLRLGQRFDKGTFKRPPPVQGKGNLPLLHPLKSPYFRAVLGSFVRQGQGEIAEGALL